MSQLYKNRFLERVISWVLYWTQIINWTPYVNSIEVLCPVGLLCRIPVRLFLSAENLIFPAIGFKPSLLHAGNWVGSQGGAASIVMKLRFTREFVVFQAAYFLHGTKNAALTEEILNGKLHFLRSALSRRDFFILPSSLIFLLIFVSKRFNESKMHLNKCDTNFTK